MFRYSLPKLPWEVKPSPRRAFSNTRPQDAPSCPTVRSQQPVLDLGRGRWRSGRRRLRPRRGPVQLGQTGGSGETPHTGGLWRQGRASNCVFRHAGAEDDSVAGDGRGGRPGCTQRETPQRRTAVLVCLPQGIPSSWPAQPGRSTRCRPASTGRTRSGAAPRPLGSKRRLWCRGRLAAWRPCPLACLRRL